TRYWRDWSSDVCSSDLTLAQPFGLCALCEQRFPVGSRLADRRRCWKQPTDVLEVRTPSATPFSAAWIRLTQVSGSGGHTGDCRPLGDVERRRGTHRPPSMSSGTPVSLRQTSLAGNGTGFQWFTK